MTPGIATVTFRDHFPLKSAMVRVILHYINRYSHGAWCCIASIIDFTIQISFGQKENQEKVVIFEEFFHNVYICDYQAITSRTTYKLYT